MSTALTTLVTSLSTTFGMGDSGNELLPVLRATCFKSNTQVSDAQMTALLVVAHQYKLNPFTKEIFAFPDKGGIVPVVSIDGWARIINEHPMFDGMEFEQDAESCTCIIHRKDRAHPTRVTEWLSECKRNTQPWMSHPKRMLRHKATIQCARLAFGFAGIYDEDEAGRILDAATKVIDERGAPKAKTFDVHVALDAVDGAASLEDLSGIWQAQGALATAAKDRGGWAALRDAVAAKRADLEQVARQNAQPDDDGVIDVEAKEGVPA